MAKPRRGSGSQPPRPPTQAVVDNDTAGWQELDLSRLASADGSRIPFRLIANRFKSSSTDCEDFIHNPLWVFTHAEGVAALSDVDDSWHVSTFVVNHHRTLSGSHLYVIAAVNPTETEIGVTLDKMPMP